MLDAEIADYYTRYPRSLLIPRQVGTMIAIQSPVPQVKYFGGVLAAFCYATLQSCTSSKNTSKQLVFLGTLRPHVGDKVQRRSESLLSKLLHSDRYDKHGTQISQTSLIYSFGYSPPHMLSFVFLSSLEVIVIWLLRNSVVDVIF